METDTALNFVRHLEDTNFQLTKTIERKNRLLMKLHDHLLYQYSGKTEEQRYSLMRELYAEAKEDHSKTDRGEQQQIGDHGSVCTCKDDGSKIRIRFLKDKPSDCYPEITIYKRGTTKEISEEEYRKKYIIEGFKENTNIIEGIDFEIERDCKRDRE